LKKIKIKASLVPNISKYSKSMDNHVEIFEKEKEIHRTTNFEYLKTSKF
jgi:hypothetical protein